MKAIILSYIYIYIFFLSWEVEFHALHSLLLLAILPLELLRYLVI